MKEDNIYYFDAENAAEMARLSDQDRIVTKYLGGHFAEFDDLSGIRRVLDVACGSGGWAQEVAFAHPEMDVVGFDISETMIKYARMQASIQGLDNVTFHVMDVQKPLDFSDHSFDFFNVRFVPFLPAAVWYHLMQEAGRVIRPGGYIRLTETEWWCMTNSPALEEVCNIVVRAIKMGGGFSTTGRSIGVVPMLAQLLKEAGCTTVQQKPYLIDHSYGTEVYEAFLQDIKVFFKLVQPQMVALELITNEAYDKLYEQMLMEMMQPTFRSLLVFIVAWGEKAE